MLKAAIPVVLAGIFGTCIAHYYKALEVKNDAFNLMRIEATKNYYELIDIVGQRHFYALQAASGYNWNLSDAKERMNRYEQSVIEWNKRRYSAIASAKRYFGDTIEDKILKLIKRFDQIHKQLIDAKKLNEQKKLYINGLPTLNLNLTLQDIYKLDDEISSFSNDLQSQLKGGDVDAYAPKKH